MMATTVKKTFRKDLPSNRQEPFGGKKKPQKNQLTNPQKTTYKQKEKKNKKKGEVKETKRKQFPCLYPL